MNENIISILKNMGWTGGFRVPIANEQNRILESNAEKIYEKRVCLTRDLKQCDDKLNLLTHHLNSAVEERRQYQEILSACKEQREIETSLRNKVETEKEVARSEKNGVQKKKKHLFEENAALQLVCGKIIEKIAGTKSTLKWGKELESLWIEFTNSEHQCVELLEKWRMKNNSILEETEMKRLCLTAEKNEYEDILRQKYRIIRDAECSSKKLRKLRQKLEKDRIHLIRQWEWLICIIATRNDEMTRLSQEITILTEMTNNLRNKIVENKHFYDEQTRNNIRITIDIRRKEIEFTNRITCKNNISAQLEHLQSNIVDQRRHLFSLNVEITKKRNNITNIRKVIDEETNTVHDTTAKNEIIRKKYLQTKTVSCSIEDRNKELIRILQNEKIKLHVSSSNCEKYEARLKKQNFSSAGIEQNLLSYDYEIKELKCAKIRLDNDNQYCEQQIEKQIDILQDLKGQLTVLTKHLQYVKGDKMNQITDEQRKELSKTSDFYNYQIKILNQVDKDLECFQLETANLEKNVANCEEQIDVLQSDNEKLLLQMDGNEKRLNVAAELYRQKLVSENIVRIRVDDLENAVTKNMNALLDLQKQKIEIDSVVRKHHFDMRAAANIFRTRKKLASQEISDIKHLIEQVRRRIRQQMKRYEIITDGTKKDRFGVPLNLINYKIQMAKERCALLEKGDQLDALVRKAEKEIQAMENTLALLNVSNNVYKCNSLNSGNCEKDTMKYEEMKQQKFKLSTALTRIEQAMEKTRNEISCYQSTISIELTPKLHELKRAEEARESESMQINRTLSEQLIKVNRVNNRIRKFEKVLKTIHANANVLQKEFISKELTKLNKYILQQFTALINRHNELAISVHQYLTTKGIGLP